MNSDKKTSNANLPLILLAMVLGVLIGLMFASHQNSPTTQDHHTLQGKMSEVLDLVEREYVDSVKVDSLSEHLLGVMLAELDPHSVYLSAHETERANEMMRGNFEGVGLVLHREGDTTFIGQILSDGPAAGMDLLPGDLIWCVDGVQVSGVGMPADSVVARLRGPRRSTVKVTVKRQQVPHTVTIRRGVVQHKSLVYSNMIDDTTGYIILSTFSVTSHDEFRQALRELVDNGMKSLIFDLRGNTGGSLESAVGIANELLPAGSLIVYTQGAHQRRQNVYARRGGLFTEGHVTVMVDEGSASASEVVSGALQDNDRATIVGRRTFGKGLVQREFNLNDGASLLLTVARYYTPSGRSIQRPYSEGTDKYYRSYLEQVMEESYSDSPTLHITDSTPYHTVGGRVVYGGGGIFPDKVITYRKDPSFIYYNNLSSKGLINRTAFAQVKLHAKEWQQRYPNLESFCHGFEVSEKTIQQLVALGEAEGIPLDSKALFSQQHLIKTMIKAYIAESLFGQEAFYRVYLSEDEDLKQARIMNK